MTFVPVCLSTLRTLLWYPAVFAMLLTFWARPASADVTVTVPANGAIVNSPFLLRAQASTCSSQPTASMAYSFDSDADTLFQGASSLDTNPSTSDGSHTLRVKAWGNSGAYCETDVAITVGGGAVVSAPADHAVVNSPFLLQAQAATCGGQSTASMAYSLDSGTDTVTNGATSLNVNISASNGGHTLRVKAWGNAGAFCETDVAITVGGGVVVSAPSDGASVSSPFNLQAQASTCGSQPTSSMAWSLDSDQDNLFKGATSLNTTVNASTTGGHILRVKAWGNNGAYCETDLDITVTSSSGGGAGGLQPGSTQNAFTGIETLSTYTGNNYSNCGGASGAFRQWQTQPDCNTPPLGTESGKSGSTTYPVLPPTPPFSGDTGVRVYNMQYSQSGGGVRWFIALEDSSNPQPSGDNPQNYHYFQYDAFVYLNDNTQIMNIEMDLNQVIADPSSSNTGQDLYIMSTQCNFSKGYWQIGGWTTTNVPCTRSQWQSGVWHHVRIQFNRGPNPGDNIKFDEVQVDDASPQPFTCGTNNGNCEVGPHRNSNWSLGTIGPNFQLDGALTNGSVTAYVDNFTIYRW